MSFSVLEEQGIEQDYEIVSISFGINFKMLVSIRERSRDDLSRQSWVF